jgi:hypothetical protein
MHFVLSAGLLAEPKGSRVPTTARALGKLHRIPVARTLARSAHTAAQLLILSDRA